MTKLWNLSVGHQHSIVYFVLIAVFIGLLLAILVGLGMGVIANRKTKKEALKSLKKPPELGVGKDKEESVPLFSGRLAEILASHGFLKVGPV
ncbi:MAG: hypothetical protein LBF76_03460, partial [Holosporales bacterium]|nr:hypothetical protein [Holosporales bacterium]